MALRSVAKYGCQCSVLIRGDEHTYFFCPDMNKLVCLTCARAPRVNVFRVKLRFRATGSADQAASVYHSYAMHYSKESLLPCASFAQTLYLNASDSKDDDQLDGATVNFMWTCIDDAGDDCVSSSGSILDIDSFASGSLVIIPADALPIGEISLGNEVTKAENRRNL